MSTDRLVCHVDMDAFFVSVEELYDPALRGKPVVVGGHGHERGVVSAASYAARKFGVHSAMPLRTARRLCPHAIFVPGHMERYREYSEKVFEVLGHFTPKAEMASIDEAYLDLTGTTRLLGPPMRIAHRLHEAIGKATGLRCSLGLASSRLVAKVTSDQAKPNGAIHVLPGQEAQFLAHLAIGKIPGIGKRAEAALHRLGVRKVGDLARLEETLLQEHFGKWGLAMAGKARGLDAGGWFDSPIGEGADPKSISHEHTFRENVADRAVLETALLKLSEMVAARLRAHRLFSRTLQLKLRTGDFHTITRAETLPCATQLEHDISTTVVRLLRHAWDGKTPVRLLGVHAGSLDRREGQLDLLQGTQTERLRQAFRSVDHIRNRYGSGSISLAKTLRSGIRERVHENPVDLPGRSVEHEHDS